MADIGRIAVLGWGEGGWVAAQAITYSDDLSALILAGTPVTDVVRPTLSAVTVPVLALYGERDPLVPAQEGVRDVRAVLGEAGHPDHQAGVVRAADHGLRVPAVHGLGGMADGRYRFGEPPAGLGRLVTDWLDQRLRPGIVVPSFPPPEHAPALHAEAAPPVTPTTPAAPAPPAFTAGGPQILPCPAVVPVRQLRRVPSS